MKNIIFCLIALSCFGLGFAASEYRHHHNTSAGDHQVQQHPQDLRPRANAQVTTHDVATQIIEPPSFSWQHLNQLIADARYEDAINQLQSQLQTTPTSALAWQLLAQIYEKQSDHQSALNAWFQYLDFENDALKRAQAYRALKDYLLRLHAAPALINDDTSWLIAQLDNLLGLTDDSELHLTLASLYTQIDDSYQAQYHALMAANDPAMQTQAEKILAQLDGGNIPKDLALPLARFGKQYLVQVNLEGHSARLLLDTGASISGVSSIYAARYPGLIKQTKPIRLNTAAGIADSYLFTVDYLTLGTLTFKQHMLALLPMHDATEFDGLLGVDILGRFDFVIDQDALLLRLRARKN